MSERPPRSLPVVQRAPAVGAGGSRGPGTESVASARGAASAVEPDARRVQAGWTYRFVAEGARAAEMIRLYRGLGFEVAADPVRLSSDPGACTECYEGSPQRYRAIYTRTRRRNAARE